ncbi:hypothetical protein ACRQ5D_34210 [Mucilaginibacter sp. P25]|uniref:hypothetical protein n=1 Tax=Mucilaginibacter sp. P25 TaxID=3423945 RepID=UPI003D79D00D
MVEATKLNSTFAELGMDSAFIEQADRLGLRTIADMMVINLRALKKNPAFSYLWYVSMLDLLKEHHLLRQFQDNQL